MRPRVSAKHTKTSSKMSSVKALGPGSQCPPYVAGTVRLYSMRFCVYSERVRVVLAHKNIKYETVNIKTSNKPEWFLSINPLCKVPALQMDDKIVCDSLILAQYLDEMFPEIKLLPADPYQRARDAMLLDLFTPDEFSNMYTFAQSGGTDQAALQKMLSMADKFEVELKRRGTPFYGGAKPMMVDFMLWPALERFFFLPAFVSSFTLPVDRYPNLQEFETRMLAVPAVQDCKLDTELYGQFFKSIISGNINYDIGL